MKNHTEGKIETSCLSNGTQWTLVMEGGGDMLADLTGCPNEEANARRLAACWNQHAKMVETLELLKRMCSEALPKFNWGASALDANAIDLLNRGMLAVDKTLLEVKGE